MPLDLSKYLALFVSEASEHAEQLGQELVRFEGPQPPAEVVDSVFRHAHSIKGMAASMEFPEIVELAHAAESLVGLFRQTPGAVPRPAVDALLSASSGLARMIRDRGSGKAGSPLPELAERLRRLAANPHAEDAAPPRAEPIAAPDPPSLRERLRSVRVKTELLDDLLEVAGELILETSRLRELSRGTAQPARALLDEGIDRMQAMLRSFHQRIVAARLTPISLVTDQLPKHLRDLARQLGREVDLAVTGSEVEVDRAIVDELADAILHLLRNSVDHGIEAPERREELGKPRKGLLRVEARRDRDRLILELSDDGRGFDLTRLRAAAVKRGALTEAAARDLPDPEALMLACLPGLSTAEAVTEISGRGVGLDAVKSSIEGLGGTFEIESRPGQGTLFRLRLPLAVALINVLLAEVDREIVALPVAKVLGALELADASWQTSGFDEDSTLDHGGRRIPVYHLGKLLGWGGLGAYEGEWVGVQPVLIVEAGGRTVALKVDRLVGQQEAVLKPLATQLSQVAGLSAVTLLGTGRPVFVLDVPKLVEA
ncbi:MAG: chemotaxis protein CheA [Myxococcales bacterium]